MAKLAGQKLRASYLTSFGTFVANQKLWACDLGTGFAAGSVVRASQIP